MPDITYRLKLPKAPRYDWLVRLSALLAAMGLATLGVALLTNSRPAAPNPPMPAKHSTTAPKSAAAAASSAQATSNAVKPLPASNPTRIEIGAIQLDSPVVTTDVGKDGSPTPPSGNDIDKAAWLKTSVTPGEQGTSVIIGHVTTIKSGESVFFNLGKLQAGQQVKVARQDGSSATFTVENVKAYSKSEFPSQTVYAKTDYPSLRLITCGEWDPAAHDYRDNVVAYARLTSTQH